MNVDLALAGWKRGNDVVGVVDQAARLRAAGLLARGEIDAPGIRFGRSPEVGRDQRDRDKRKGQIPHGV